MPLWPPPPAFPPPIIINMSGGYTSPFASLLNAGSGSAITQVQAGAGVALIQPFYVPELYEVVKLWWRNGTTLLAGNVQAGVYSIDFALLGSCAATAQSGADAIQDAGPSAALVLPRGNYYFALMNTSTGTFSVYNAVGNTTIMTQLSKAAGQLLATSASPLPATLSPVVTTAGFTLIAGVSSRSLVG